jgi:N-acetylglutamate synthase-like GNAT family acetyltransferase
MYNEDIIIKEYNPIHNDSINQLLSICFSDDNKSRMYFERGWKSPNNLCTYVALHENEVVGAITTWKTNFHPNCTYMSIIVHPLYREFGMERLLLNILESNQNADLPLQTSICETNYFTKVFYEKSGFKEIRRTYLPLLKITEIHELDVKLLQKYSNTQLSIETVSVINKDEKLKNKLISLVKNTYEETHRDNPPRKGDLHAWEKLIFNKDTLVDNSYIVLSENNDILAYALLHEGENDNTLEFGWRGTKVENDFHLIVLLTAIQIRFAKSKGYKYIEGEIDTSDPYSMEMLKIFPFSPSPTLITYQKIN